MKRREAKRSVGMVAAVAASMLAATTALADSSHQARARADVLYEEAGTLMAMGRFADACPRLVASRELDPAIGTAIRLAHCYLRTGRTARAFATFEEAERMARAARDPRAVEAAKQMKLLEPRLSKLGLVVAPDTRAPDTTITRDGEVVARDLWETPAPLDPGDHTVKVTRPGRLAWTWVGSVGAEPGTTTVRVPALSLIETARSGGARRMVGLGLAVGGGLAGAGAGAAFGLLAQTRDGAEATPMRVATGLALGLGGAAVAAGLAVFFTAPAEPAKRVPARLWTGPAFGGGAGGWALQGTW